MGTGGALNPAFLTSWLCVSGIPHGYDEQQLRDLCERFGTVCHAEIAKDRERRPLEFGFVETARPEEAQHARNALDGKALAGKILTVVLVKEPADCERPEQIALASDSLSHG